MSGTASADNSDRALICLCWVADVDAEFTAFRENVAQLCREGGVQHFTTLDEVETYVECQEPSQRKFNPFLIAHRSQDGVLLMRKSNGSAVIGRDSFVGWWQHIVPEGACRPPQLTVPWSNFCVLIVSRFSPKLLCWEY